MEGAVGYCLSMALTGLGSARPRAAAARVEPVGVWTRLLSPSLALSSLPLGPAGLGTISKVMPGSK